jgi:hypothetical protein
MSINRDARYDVLFADTDANGQVIEQLGLILREANNGGIDYSMQAVSPFAGQLSQGDIQDKDLTRWTVRSQRNWQGGQGQGYAYQETDAFQQAVMETRYRNQIMLPPLVTQTTIAAPTDPQWQPSGTTNNGTRLVNASWTARTPTSQNASASWSTAGRTPATVQASGSWNAVTRTAVVNSPDVTNAITVTSTTALAMSFTLANPSNVDYINTWINGGSSAPYLTLEIRTDSAGSPSATVLATTGTVISLNPSSSGIHGAGVTPVLLSTGVTYWFVVTVPSGSIGVRYNTTYSGTCRQFNGSVWNIVGGGQKGSFEITGTPYVQGATTWQGQRFLSPGNTSMTSAKARLSRAGAWTAGTVLTLELRAAGTTTAPGAVVASGTVSADPGTTETWITFNITASLVAGAYYWFVLKVDSAPISTVTINWHGDSAQGYAPAGTAQPGYQSTNFGGAWTNTSKCQYFYVNSGYSDSNWVPFFYPQKLSKTRIEANFTPAATTAMTQMKVYIDRTTWAGSPTLRLRIFNGLTQVATATAADPGATAAWVQFTMSATLTIGVAYTIVLEVDAPDIFDVATVRMYGDNTSGATLKDFVSESYGWNTSFGPLLRPFFLVNSTTNYPVVSTPYYFTHTGSETRRAQQFTVGASPVAMTFVRLRLKRTNWQGSPTLTLRLYSNSAGLPNTSLASASLTSAMFDTAGAVTSDAWVQVTIAFSLVAATSYHLALEPDAPTVADAVTVEWYGDTLNGYASNQPSTSTASDGFAFGAWSAATADLYFMINNGSPLAAAVTVQPQRFGASWYVASGAQVFRWNTGTSVWDSVYNSGGASITALCEFNGRIYAALGDATDMVDSATGNSGAWTATAGSRRYTYLRAFGGFLYAAKAAGGVGALAYTNGTQWTTTDQLADASVVVTGLATMQNELIILSTARMYSLSSQFVYQIYNYDNEQAADNGRNAAQWVADGRLYVPIRNGLNAFDGMRMEPVGPETTEGLPSGEQGRISAMAGTKNYLFAAIDAGASGRSTIFAFNGRGWHCLAEATATGRRIRAIGIEATTAANGFARLWWWEDATPFYMEFPDLSDNPFNISGARYAASGELTSSRFGGELAQIVKDIQSVVVRTEGCSANQRVEVWVEVDGTGIWTQLGTVTESPYQEIVTNPGTMATKAVAAGSTRTVINIAGPGTTSDCTPGAFVRINNEVVQIATVPSVSQFTLATPLTDAPVAGDSVYASRPAGREIRYRLVMRTNSPTLTPRVFRVSIRWQEQILGFFRFSMGIEINDELRLRTGQQSYGVSANELRRILYRWGERSTPFTMVAPDGSNWRVKVTSFSESGWTRKETAGKPMRLSSVVRFQFDEV